MSEILYWAIKLTDASRAKLLMHIKPIHSEIYAEHLTLVFRPTKEDNKLLAPWLGKEVDLKIITIMSDGKGQAVGVISEPQRLDGNLGHITISCAPGTKPVYSNTLLVKTRDELNSISPFDLIGVVSKFVNGKWKTS